MKSNKLLDSQNPGGCGNKFSSSATEDLMFAVSCFSSLPPSLRRRQSDSGLPTAALLPSLVLICIDFFHDSAPTLESAAFPAARTTRPAHGASRDNDCLLPLLRALAGRSAQRSAFMSHRCCGHRGLSSKCWIQGGDATKCKGFFFLGICTLLFLF